MAQQRTVVVVCIQVQIENNDIEHARRECLVQIVARLTDLGSNLIVYERREDNPSKNSDKALFERARRDGYIPRDVRLFAGHPAAEPLLWGPDLIGWALRRHLAVSDSQWIEPLLNRLEIMDSSAEKALNGKGPQPAAAKGSDPESLVGLNGEGENRSSSLSMPRLGDKEKNLFEFFPKIARPFHEPELLATWLKVEFPKRHK